MTASIALSQYINYVKPNDSSVSCPGQPCLTLSQYAHQAARFFTSGASFIFLTGNHSVHSTVLLQNVFDVHLRGKSNVTVLYMDTPTIQCSNVTNLTIEGIMFVFTRDSIHMPIISSYVLSVIDSQEVLLHNLIFQQALAGAAYFNHSNVSILESYFEGNVGVNGGSIYAGESNITLDGNDFINNKATHSGGAIYINKSSLLMKEALGNIFTNNSANHNGGAIVCIYSNLSIVSDTTLGKKATSSTIFQNNSAHGNNGGAIDCISGSLLLTARTILFAFNYARGKGGAIAIHNSVTVFLGGIDINFINNSAYDDGGGIFIKNSSQVIISTERINFLNNSAYDGGGLNVEYSSLIISSENINFVSNSVGRVGGGISLYKSILQCYETNFIDNYAYFQGGGIHCILSTCNVTLAKFIGNSADIGSGGGIDCEKSNCTVMSAVFINNTAASGAIGATMSNAHYHNINVTGTSRTAVFVAKSNISFSGGTKMHRNVGELGGGIRAIDSSVFITGTAVFEENYASNDNGGAIFMFTAHLNLNGIVLFESNEAFENGGAISAGDLSSITLSNQVTFISNTARDKGGAMYFDNGATITLNKNTTLTTSHNHALTYGGAIYHSDSLTSTQCEFEISVNDLAIMEKLPRCFFNFESESFRKGNPAPWAITSTNDSAGKDGGFLYGGLLDKCQASIYVKIRNMIQIVVDVLYSILMTYDILEIKSNDTAIAQPISSAPYVLCFCESNQEYNCSKVMHIETYRGRKFTVSLLTLAQGDYITSTPVRAELGSTARIKVDQTLQILLRNCTDLSYNLYSTKPQDELILYIDGGTCSDVGMAQVVIDVNFLSCPDGLTLSGDQCVCEERLNSYSAVCTIFDDDIYITRKAGSKFWLGALYSNKTYEGLILSKVCPVEYCKTSSVNISLNQLDAQCDHNHSGLLCGGCAANYSLMLGSSQCKICTNTLLVLLLPFAATGLFLVFFLTYFRLTVGNGMINSIIFYANIVQTNRSLLFPCATNTSILTVFIAWMNLDLGFQTCFFNGMNAHVQTWLQFAFPLYVWILISVIILTSRYSVTVTKLTGSNPIDVLATLLLMSYNKILKIIIEVYSYVKLDYPGNETVTVWLKDANLPYLQSWHLALTVVTTLVLIFLFLPYTLLLLLGHKLYRFAGRKYTRWFIRITMLLNAYYGPYKFKARYWPGFLLLVRCAMYIVLSYNSLGNTTMTLLTINITMTLLAGIVLSLRVYINLYTNIIEVLVFLNLLFLSVAALGDVNPPFVVNSLVGVVFIIMIGIILYHIYLQYIAKSRLWKKIMKIYPHATNSEITPLLSPTSNSTPSQKAMFTQSIVSISENDNEVAE